MYSTGLSGWVVSVKEGIHSLTFKTQVVEGSATGAPSDET